MTVSDSIENPHNCILIVPSLQQGMGRNGEHLNKDQEKQKLT